MRNISAFIYFSSLLTIFSIAGNAQSTNDHGTISLNNWDAFQQPGSNWVIGSSAKADFMKTGSMTATAGGSVAINIMHDKNNSHLITKKEYGDIKCDLDFMMAKGSNSGVYMEGRYEIQLFDSWTRTQAEFADCGGIYQRWDESRGLGNEGFEGIAPNMNVCRAPGLWQHLTINFRAPRFNAKGEKTEDARFQTVFLNGVLIQVEAAVTGPTRASYFTDERPTGPILFQGDHGNVAFRNISVSPVDNILKPLNPDNPIVLNPPGKPYLLRSFLNFGPKKLTHVISAGYPNQINYSYDLKQGALLQVWRGQFLDVTDMWHERGEPQLAKPLGSVIALSDAPVLSVLTNEDSPWPDSVAFDELQNKGYTLDKNRFPTFEYVLQGLPVTDKISADNTESLTRELTVFKPPESLYVRVAVGDSIESLGKGLYSVDDHHYYLQIDEHLKAAVRKRPSGQEIIVAWPKGISHFIYSIIW